MIAMQCSHCKLELRDYERGGRLVGLITIFVAAILIMAAMGLDLALAPPLWLQMVIWAPFTIATVIGVLRIYKTALLYARYEAQTDEEASER